MHENTLRKHPSGFHKIYLQHDKAALSQSRPGLFDIMTYPINIQPNKKQKTKFEWNICVDCEPFLFIPNTIEEWELDKMNM